jgi:hypothetical protein
MEDVSYAPPRVVTLRGDIAIPAVLQLLSFTLYSARCSQNLVKTLPGWWIETFLGRGMRTLAVLPMRSGII